MVTKGVKAPFFYKITLALISGITYVKNRERDMKMTKYTYSDELYSDLYKDSCGSRPSVDSINRWKASDPDDKQKSWDYMSDLLASSEAVARISEAKASEEVEKEINNNIDLGAPTRKDAIRWLLDSMSLDDVDVMYGGESVAFAYGVSFRDPLVKEFDEILEERKDEAYGRFYDEAA